ncbi:MAG: ATP-binding cassette domain-containing protein, partial [Candidatus Dormiibacterota bacterium]
MPRLHPTTTPTSAADSRRGVFAQHLTLRTAGALLLDDASFAVAGGRHAGLVGRNGSGKSTLLETVVALARRGGVPDHVSLSGVLRVAPGLTVGRLPQSPQLEWSGSVAGYLDEHAGDVGAVWQEHERLLGAMRSGADDTMTLTAYGDALEAMERAGGWAYEQQRAAVLHGLALDPALLTRPVPSLSGGEATRVALAALLVAPAELLLLDEPTNNLDAGAARYLARWIEETTAAVLVVSHDRDLLDRVDEILEIEEGTSRVLSYGGGFDLMEAQKQVALEAKQRAFADQETRRARLEGAVAGISARAQAFQDHSQNDFYRRKGAKVARGAKAQAVRVARELQRLEEPDLPAQPRFVVEPPRLTSGALLRLASVGLGGADRSLVRGLDLALGAGDRLAITGPNGSGKTTLLRVLAGGPSTTGTVWRHADLRLGVLPQTLPAPAHGDSLLAYAQRFADAPADQLRERVGKVVFADPARRRATEASEGELRRTVSAALFAAGPDLLLLDEPTNHLDLQSVDLLEV